MSEDAKLDPAQTYRCRPAQGLQLDVTATTDNELTVTAGELTDSLPAVLGVFDDICRGVDVSTPTTLLCDYCERPAEHLRARLKRADPASRLVALDHADCYPLFMDGLVLMSGGVEGAYPAAGWYHRCQEWTPRGRVIAEIHTNSAASATVVRCLDCCRDTARPPAPATPPHAYVVEDVVT